MPRSIQFLTLSLRLCHPRARPPDYVGTLQQLDDNIGALVAMLKAKGVWEDTLFFFTRYQLADMILRIHSTDGQRHLLDCLHVCISSARSDNGPHCDETSKLWPEVHCGGIHIGRSSGGQGVTKGVGLRGCKASNWDGGIRVMHFSR